MRLLILSISSLLLPTFLFSQARVIVNNDVRMVMDGGVYLVVDNQNTNAITTTGTADGNIISEDENNKVRWITSTGTGSYVIPFRDDVSSSNQAIPLTVNITSAGDASGFFDFSTYETATDANTPYPSMVTHMLDASDGTTDNSLWVADRFTLIDGSTYTTKPDVSLTISYVNTAAELQGTNALVESNLVAQRFNSTTGAWNGVPSNAGLEFGTGTLNTGNRTIGPFAVTGADLFEAWVLVDGSNLLPIDLLNFNSQCEQSKAVINWTTATESNNDYFTILRSVDGLSFNEVGLVDGAGTSTSPLNYYFTDYSAPDGLVYYKLRQTDFDGAFEEFGPISSNCKEEDEGIHAWSQADGELMILLNSGTEGTGSIQLLDAAGRLIVNEASPFQRGNTSYSFNLPDLANGIYMLRITIGEETYLEKIYVQ